MADYSWKTTATYRHEWSIPVRTHDRGCAIAEFHKALHAADCAYAKLAGPPNTDDYLRVSFDDENIIIFFETDDPPPQELIEKMMFNYRSKEV